MIDGLARKAERNGTAGLDAVITELVEYLPARPRRVPPGHLGLAVRLRLRAGERQLALLTTLAHAPVRCDHAIA